MKVFIRVIIAFYLAGFGYFENLASVEPIQAAGTISLDSMGIAYSQNFNTLAISEESATLPAGWVIAESGGETANSLYFSNNGSRKNGDTYSYGSTNSSDRALGTLQTDDLSPIFGAAFTNNTGGTINALEIQYAGERWRCGKINRVDKLIFQYSLNATSLQNGTWIAVEDLVFKNPPCSTVGSKDGNASENQLVFEPHIITGLALEPGTDFWIRWVDHNSTIGDDDGLAVDDFSITPKGIDLPPAILFTSPAQNETLIDLDSNISLTFSEPVTLSSGWFSINCSKSGLHTAAIQGGPVEFTLLPDHDFDYDENCEITVFATKVTDQDVSDPPDNLETNYAFAFFTKSEPDATPAILNISPANDATDIPLNGTISILISEPVSVAYNWADLQCSKSGNHTYTTNQEENLFTLVPDQLFTYDETCTIRLNAEKVTDLDTDDPPDRMAANSVSVFSTIENTDIAPALESSYPSNGDVNIDLDRSISLVFTEPVNLDDGSVEISCSRSGGHTFELSGGTTSYQIDPILNFTYDEDCTLLLTAEKIKDEDIIDPPDEMLADQVIAFSTVHQPDQPPSIISSLPSNQADSVALNSSILFEFSEPVTLGDNWASLTCTTSGSHPFDISNEGLVYTLNPQSDFVINESCLVHIYSMSIKDTDVDDPPDGMDADIIIEFDTITPEDEAPSVVSTTPQNESVGIQTAGIFHLTFSEPVWLHPGWISIQCSKSGLHEVTIFDGPINYSYAPLTDFEFNETCTVILKADAIRDLDELDPPNWMKEDYSYSFTTMHDPYEIDYPVIVSSSPLDGETLSTSFHGFSIQFSEEVLHDGGSDAADNPQNYRLISAGPNTALETISCNQTAGDDFLISIDQINYFPATFKADLEINQRIDLLPGQYRLIVCGTQTIRDLDGNAINNGIDSFITFQIQSSNPGDDIPSGNKTTPNSPGGSNNASNPSPQTTVTPGSDSLMIPVTGFAPDRFTRLPDQTGKYTNSGDLWLEIPSMNIEIPIVGVPKNHGEWDVTWLNDQAGWLEGSAFPTFIGNSVLTAHVWDAINRPGPFYGLESVKFDDEVIVHAWGSQYVYAVREVKKVSPSNVNAMLKHQESPWLTLVTCQEYDEEEKTYKKRILVRAVLIEIKE